MKSTINIESHYDGNKYPFLGQNIENNDVVLFKESKVGTIIYSSVLERIGYHSIHFCMEGFKPFNGIVTLEDD